MCNKLKLTANFIPIDKAQFIITCDARWLLNVAYFGQVEGLGVEDEDVLGLSG